MQNRNSLNSILDWCCFACLALFFLSTPLLAADAELLWANSGVTHEIMISQYIEQQWSNAESIYQSENPLTSIAFATDLDGVKVLIWSEVFRTRTVLMKMQLNRDTKIWSTAKVFSGFAKESLAATMVVDSSNSIWVFWSANQGDLDDIYFARRTAMGWSKPQRVNDKNEVPDIRPRAHINQQGKVEVNWQTYSFAASEYVTNTQVFEIDKQSSARTGSRKNVQKKTELTLGEISLPPFLGESLSSLLHFPENRNEQSIRVE